MPEPDVPVAAPLPVVADWLLAVLAAGGEYFIEDAGVVVLVFPSPRLEW